MSEGPEREITHYNDGDTERHISREDVDSGAEHKFRIRPGEYETFRVRSGDTVTVYDNNRNVVARYKVK